MAPSLLWLLTVTLLHLCSSVCTTVFTSVFISVCARVLVGAYFFCSSASLSAHPVTLCSLSQLLLVTLLLPCCYPVFSPLLLSVFTLSYLSVFSLLYTIVITLLYTRLHTVVFSVYILVITLI